MRSSIKLRLMLIMVSLVSVVFGLVLGINSLFLERYYSQTKEEVLTEVYESLENISSSDSAIYDDANVEILNKACETSGVTLLVVDSSGMPIYAYGASSKLKLRLVENIFGQSSSISSKVLKSADNYQMLKVVDEDNQIYVEMTGVLNRSKNYFIMRIAMESIKESVGIANRFLLIICILGIVFSLIVVFFASNYYTKPILELANISKKMSEMDFDVKYKEKRNDEIGILGTSMNELSEKLEETISNLKKANLSLKKDIEKKTEIDNMRKEFISNVSHELKTPIALIQGYAEGLKEGVNDDEESKNFYCEVIMDEANKMNTMVKNLLTLNQIESGTVPPTIERFDLVLVIKGVLDRVKLLADAENVNIIFECEKRIDVWADEFQIEEVITNYVSNAINHCTDDKIIRITIKQDEDVVRVGVFNSGKHIPEEELNNIWVKFYKIDKARTREYGGSGIGLSIVKAIMETHGRNCGVNNVEGGVEFWFELDNSETSKGQTK